MRSTLESAPKKETGASSGRANAVRATVAGLDESGHMFRDTVSILALEGQDCIFQGKSKPELNSWVLVEILPSKTGDKATSVQGQVMTLEPDSEAANQYRIRVELETKQSLKIGDISQEMKAAALAHSPVPAPRPAPAAASMSPAVPLPIPVPAAAPAPFPAPVSTQILAPPATPATPAAVKVNAIQPEKDTLVQDSAPKISPPSLLNKTKTEPSGELPQPAGYVQPKKVAVLPIPEIPAPKTVPITAPLDKGAISAAVTQEVKQQLAAAKTGLNEDLEKAVQRSVAQEMKQHLAASDLGADGFRNNRAWNVKGVN